MFFEAVAEEGEEEAKSCCGKLVPLLSLLASSASSLILGESRGVDEYLGLKPPFFHVVDVVVFDNSDDAFPATAVVVIVVIDTIDIDAT